MLAVVNQYFDHLGSDYETMSQTYNGRLQEELEKAVYFLKEKKKQVLKQQESHKDKDILNRIA